MARLDPDIALAAFCLACANAIRAKTGGSAAILPLDFPDAITSIGSGGTADASKIVSGYTIFDGTQFITGTFASESKSATPSTSAQSITPTDAGHWLSSVSISAIQTEEKTVTASGDVTPSTGKYLSKVIVNVPLPTLNAPSISITDSTLTITNPSTNGNFANGYKVYSGETLIATVTSETVNLSTYLTAVGTYSITVKCHGTNFNDSNMSNAVSYVVATAPTISAQPQSASYTAGGTATALSVTASTSDGGELSYQWQKSVDSGTTYSNISGANTSTYTPDVSTESTNMYRCVVTNTLNGTTASTTSNAATITVTASAVIGFTGLTNSTDPTPDLVFTDDISAVSKYTTTTDGSLVNVTNGLDDYFPFCDIAEMTDADGNVFVKYPKMWIKWVLDGSGNIDGIKISNAQADGDYFIPDAFLDPSDGVSYLDYFALGKYEASGSSSKIYSKSGQACYANMTRAVARTAARAYGTSTDNYNGYQQIDLSMLVIYNFLCMMYYKTPNIQRVYGGRTGSETPGWASAANTGSCDGITGLNGWDTVTDCVKMLGIENPFGNISKWIDGVYFSSATIYAHRLPQQYADSTANAVDLGFPRPSSTSGDYISKLKKGTSDATRSYAYCSEASGSATKYVGDWAAYYVSGVVLCAGGYWDHTSKAGLWYLSGYYTDSTAGSSIGGRLAYRPL